MSRSIKLRDVLVLGLLRERPRYGYEIKQIIDNVMSHIIDVSSGSLYYGIKKLQDRNCVEETAVEKVGRRPERSVYKITEAGRELLEQELPRAIFPKGRAFSPLDLAMYFFELMDPRERCRRLKMRLLYLELALEYLNELDERFSGVAPHSHHYIMVHSKILVNAEQKFISQVVDELANGSIYELTDTDIAEVENELVAFKERLKYETVVQIHSD